MSNFARTYLSQLGDMLGDVESKIYRFIKGSSGVETPHGIITVRKDETGFRRLFLDGKPLMHYGVEKAIDILDYLENDC